MLWTSTAILHFYLLLETVPLWHLHLSGNWTTHPFVDVRQSPPEGACRKAPEGDVGAEDSGAGAQWVGSGLRLLKAAHPPLEEQQDIVTLIHIGKQHDIMRLIHIGQTTWYSKKTDHRKNICHSYVWLGVFIYLVVIICSATLYLQCWCHFM